MIEHDGKMYTRVSDILRPFSDFSGIDPEVLANKARIGTQVHDAISDDTAEDFPCVPADCMGYFKSFLEWKKALKPIFVRSEQRYYCDDLMITGQIDALVHLNHCRQLSVLVDFKTSASESKVTWPMQAHLYYYLLNVNGIVPHPSMLFIKLDKKGALPQVFTYTWSPNMMAKCMNAVEDYRKSEKREKNDCINSDIFDIVDAIDQK